jgi:tRNA A37 threonylcarbamoyladenosine dehydratase/predicted adenine nucleotide alpha hydrolase (AANH) superfamily ATPase
MRRDCLSEFAANEKLNLIMQDEYGLRLFLDEVKTPDNGRCQKCYSIRLQKTAFFAAQEGYSAFSTTLLISPYQDHEAIKRAGEEAALKYGIEFLYRDFRPFFREGQSAARAKNLYMQKYCGCIFSEEERYLNKRIKTNENQSQRINTNEDKSQRIARLKTNEELKIKELSSFAPAFDQMFDRLELIAGSENLKKIRQTKVVIIGLGGVGSWAAEALVRSGIGKIVIVDFDTVCASNINRQIQATAFNIGQSKAQVLKNHLLEINPECEITAFDEFFCRANANVFGIESADYVIDAIDLIINKLDLIETVHAAGVTLFSSMGMALKTDPSQIKTASIWDTQVCPLARNVRNGLKKRGYTGDFTVVYSKETPKRAGKPQSFGERPVIGSLVTVTASAGFMLASLVLRDIMGM